MKYKMRMAALVLMLIIFHCSFLNAKAITSASGKSAEDSDGKLIVSMIYDDSESMRISGDGTRESYCNYAFQFFISLFNEEDELYITYMSHPDKTYNYTIRDNRQQLVDTFRNHNGGATSSIESIKSGYNKLQETPSNPNDTYWLLVLSDGGIYNEEGKLSDSRYLDRYFDMYANQKMPNGSDLNIFFVGIGEESVLPTQNLDKKISVSHAKDASSLVDIVNDFAVKISGCLSIDDIACITKKNGEKEVFLETQIPIERMIVVVQDSDARLLELRSNEKNYTVNEHVFVEDSNLNYESGAVNSFQGSVNYVEPKKGLAKGQYTIAFNKEVDMENVTIYCRPNLEVKFSIKEYNTGNLIDNIYDLVSGDEISISYELFEKGTNQVVDANLLSDQVKTRFEIFNENTLVIKSDETSKTIPYYKVTNGSQRIQAMVTVDDLISIANVVDVSMYDLRVVENESVSRFDLLNDKKPIKLKLYKNNVAVTGTDLNKLFLDYDINDRHINVTSRFNSDGTIDIIPTYGQDSWVSKLWYGWKSTWDVKSQDYAIRIAIKDADQVVRVEDTLYLSVNQEDKLVTIFYFMLPWGMLVLLLGYCLKKRFSPSLKLMRVELKIHNQSYIGNKEEWQYEYFVARGFRNTIKWTSVYSLIPFVRNKKQVGGIVFEAGKKNNANETVSFKPNGHHVYLVKDTHITSLQNVMLSIQNENIVDVSYDDVITLRMQDGFIIQDGEHFYLHKLSKGGF